MAIQSTVEPRLGIIATAACVLGPLTKRFYGLSSYGTSRIRDTNTHPSTWYNKPANTTRSKTFPEDMKSCVIVKDGIEMDEVVTSVLGNQRGERGREWTRRNPASVQRSRVGNESEEESTREGKGIIVHKMVKIRTHETTVSLKFSILVETQYSIAEIHLGGSFSDPQTICTPSNPEDSRPLDALGYGHSLGESAVVLWRG